VINPWNIHRDIQGQYNVPWVDQSYHVPSVNTRIDQPMEHYINLGCLGEYHVPSVNTRIDQPMEHYIDLGWLCEEVTNTNFIVFDLTRSGLDPKIYRPRGEHASHYTTDVVYSWRKY
jgi:hypothetical protein